MEWINVKDRLPEIPKGKFAVSVIVAEFDRVFEEISPGRGYSVGQKMWMLVPDTEEYWFCDLLIGGGDGSTTRWDVVSDEVSHWMYLPESPKK